MQNYNQNVNMNQQPYYSQAHQAHSMSTSVEQNTIRGQDG